MTEPAEKRSFFVLLTISNKYYIAHIMNTPRSHWSHRLFSGRNIISLSVAATCVGLLLKDPEPQWISQWGKTSEAISSKTPEQLYKYFSEEFHARLKKWLEEKSKNWSFTTTQEQFFSDIDILIREDVSWRELSGYIKNRQIQVSRDYLREGPFLRFWITFQVPWLPTNYWITGRNSFWSFVDPRSGLSL